MLSKVYLRQTTAETEVQTVTGGKPVIDAALVIHLHAGGSDLGLIAWAPEHYALQSGLIVTDGLTTYWLYLHTGGGMQPSSLSSDRQSGQR